MKTPKLPCVAIMLMALPAFGAAIETVSEPFVGSAVTIPGVEPGALESVGAFSLRAVRPALYAGRVSSVGTTTIADANANWTSAQFIGRGALYAEFQSGIEADIQQVSFVSKTLSFSGALPPSIVPGTPFRIREHHTVAELFGPANEAGLLPGVNRDVAEQVLHYIPETQETRTYYYLTFNGITGWYRNNIPASNTVIYPEQALMIRRRTPEDLTLTWTGPLKTGPSVIPIFPEFNFLGVYNHARPVRLADLNLITGNPATGFTPGPNANAGDNLLVVNPSGTPTRYYYLNLQGFEGWYTGNQRADNVTVAPGTAFFLFRRPPAGTFDWTLPSQ